MEDHLILVPQVETSFDKKEKKPVSKNDNTRTSSASSFELKAELSEFARDFAK